MLASACMDDFHLVSLHFMAMIIFHSFVLYTTFAEFRSHDAVTVIISYACDVAIRSNKNSQQRMLANGRPVDTT